MENNDKKLIAEFGENYKARKRQLWKEAKESPHDIARVIAGRALTETDEKYAKFLQTSGILKSSESSSLDILLALNRGTPLKGKQQPLIVDAQVIEDEPKKKKGKK